VPDHSAYVSLYEMGGVILCVLVGLLWIRILQIAITRILRGKTIEEFWPPVVSLMIAACSLGFGTGYEFPLVGPALAIVFLLGDPLYPSGAPVPSRPDSTVERQIAYAS
jgi:hypothetical protein